MKDHRLLVLAVLLAIAALALTSCTAAQAGASVQPITAASGGATPTATAGKIGTQPSPGAGTPAPRETNVPASGKTNVPAGKPNFLSARGSKIIDADGNEVTITGVNWFGMETGVFAPHGLWSRNWEEMLDQIKSVGFNTIRLPYSNQLFDPDSKVGEGVDFGLNPDLAGLTPLQVMDKIVEGAGKRGLKVILDRHRPDANGQSKLWYTDKYPESRWISDWVALAQRYRGNDTVIGADLHNEPAGEATWGTGDPRTDWRMAAEKAGNAILEANPDWLIIVEGIEKSSGTPNDWYWMGGNLTDAGKNLVRLKIPNRVVYSPHDYGPGVYNQSWFIDKSFPNNLPGIWDSHWGYLIKQGIAPVMVGEFGGRSVGSDTEGTWQRALVQYLKGQGAGYTYWSLNPNSGDTGGVLKDDWRSVDQDKQKLLASYQGPAMRVGNPSQVNSDSIPGPTAVATAPAGGSTAPKAEAPRQNTQTDGTSSKIGDQPATSPTAKDGGVRVLYATDRTETVTNNPSMHLKVMNAGPSAIRLGALEVRYWFNPDDPSGKKQVVDVDWASVGSNSVGTKVVQINPQLEYMALTFGSGDKLLDPGAALEVAVRLHKDDWSPYNQKNHYSFSLGTEQKENSKITAYSAGKLVWGSEPKR